MISVVRLENWRAYESFELNLKAGTTFLVANNGVGKTSLIDAVRWALDPQMPPQPDMLRGSARTGSVEVELTAGIHQLRIKRTLTKGRAKVPRSVMIGWIDQVQQQDVGAVYRLLEGEWSAEHSFLARAAFMTDRLLYADEEPDLRSHLSEVFGLDQLQQVIDELAPAIKDAKRAAESRRADETSTKDDLRRAEELAQQMALELDRARAAERTARGLAETANEIVDNVERGQAAAVALASWHKERARIADAAIPVIGETPPGTDLRMALESSEEAFRTQAEAARERLAVLSSRTQAVNGALTRLRNAHGDCPTCLRPLDEASRAAAEHKHLAEERAASEEIKEIDVEGPMGLVAQVRELLRNAVELGNAPTRIDVPAGDPSELQSRASKARTELETAVADVREAEVRLADAASAAESMRAALTERAGVPLLYRRQAMLETAKLALDTTINEVLGSELGPIADEVNRRWEAVFAHRSSLRLDADGGITRPLEDLDLEFSAFSSGEKTMAKLLFRISILLKTTNVPFLWVDEPLEHLDPDARRFVATTLAHLSADNTLPQILVTTYEEPLAKMLAYRDDSPVYIDYLCTAPST